MISGYFDMKNVFGQNHAWLFYSDVHNKNISNSLLLLFMVMLGLIMMVPGCGGSSNTGATSEGSNVEASTALEDEGDVAVVQRRVNTSISGNFEIQVLSVLEQDAPVEGASVSINNAQHGNSVAEGMTDSDGVVTFDGLDAGVSYVVEVQHEAYVTSNKRVESFLKDNETREISVLLLKESRGFVWTEEDTGGTLNTEDGVFISVGPNAFVVENTNEPVDGDVTVVITEIDVANPDHLAAYPGSLIGVFDDGSQDRLHTYGVIDINFYDADGNYLQLAQGESAEIVFPMSQTKHEDGSDVMAGDSIGLWTLDETTGRWLYDSEGVVENTDQGLVVRGTKTHFSSANMDKVTGENGNYWNVMNLDADIPFGEGFAVKPQCLAVEFWIYKYDPENRVVSSENTFVCQDDLNKKHHFELPEGDTRLTGYCWKVQMMINGSQGYLAGGDRTIGEPVTFCQEDIRSMINNNDCENFSTNSQENADHCTSLSDHIGMNIQFGINYEFVNGIAEYSILAPEMMTSYEATSITQVSAGGESITALFGEGKKLVCQSVCDSPLRDDSAACTVEVVDDSC